MNNPYSSFCFFNFEKGLISTKILDSTKEFLIQENFVFEKATTDSDLLLLNFCKNNSTSIKSLLCLRSRVSQSIASCIQKIFKDNINTDLELNWIPDFNKAMIRVAEQVQVKLGKIHHTYRYNFDRKIPVERITSK